MQDVETAHSSFVQPAYSAAGAATLAPAAASAAAAAAALHHSQQQQHHQQQQQQHQYEQPSPSVLSLVPQYRVEFRSSPQLSELDTPFQLGLAPRKRRPAEGDAASTSADGDGLEIDPESAARFQSPSDASSHSVTVLENDLVILATDGLFDNLSEADIVAVANDCELQAFTTSSGRTGAAPEAVARALGAKAYEMSLSRTVDSPFALLAKENLIMWSGGRPDDITVVCARVARGGGRMV
jgi:serine/threonine protein phosphatase PrpC